MLDSPALTTAAVRRYYEQNTRLFLRFQGAGLADTIHRAVWAPSVQTKYQALNYANQLVLDEIEGLVSGQGLEQVRLADLGCGVGGSLFYVLARLRTPVQAVGLTISPLQAQLAAARARQLGRQANCFFVEADFLRLPLAAGFDFGYSVEAFVHAVDPGAYFNEAARLLGRGGRLALVDDFLTPTGAAPRPAWRAWVEAYRTGWHVPGLVPLERAVELARAAGLRLVETRPLTHWLRLAALPDLVARLLRRAGQAAPGVHAILPGMLGSLALQQCLKMGLVEYRFVVFEKP
jgi:SAM-dependent methyltransferase